MSLSHTKFAAVWVPFQLFLKLYYKFQYYGVFVEFMWFWLKGSKQNPGNLRSFLDEYKKMCLAHFFDQNLNFSRVKTQVN